MPGASLPLMFVAMILAYASAVFGLGLAITAFWNERRSIASASFALGMALLSLEAACMGMGAWGDSSGNIMRWKTYAWAAMALQPGTWLVFSLCYSRGNHREFLHRWWPVIGTAFLAPLGVLTVFYEQMVVNVQSLGPGGDWLIAFGGPAKALNIIYLLGAVLILMNLERTFRTSVGTMRWRIKFMILGLGVLFIVRIFTSSQALLFSATTLSFSALNATALLISCGLIALSLKRSSLFNVDLYPSHTVIFNSLTVLLAGLYLLAVGIFAKLVSPWGGSNLFALQSFIVLAAIVLLAILLFSDRLRQRLQRFVSHHFHRPIHDYRKVWATFTERTVSLVNDIDLCREVTKWMSETFNVLSVTIWLADESRERLLFAASTSMPEARASDLVDAGANWTAIFDALLHQTQPIDLNERRDPWVETLKQCNPAFFPNGGTRICVPLVSSGQLMGLMVVGDRVSGLTYSLEDLDLLKCLGDQIGSSLLSLRLSKRLLQAKEMEAFQTMSAFFVHDLKNTASTLSLMLQNLQVHFEDPAFREDAMRAVSKSVTHINDLISRLTLLRQELKISPQPCDLNKLAEEACASIGDVPGITLSHEWKTLPQVQADPVQLNKVIVNLLLNARDAVGKSGAIQISTDQINGWAVLAVSDNGCGMSPEFINRSLFRPFQTTKKKGIGIGMFHSKAIVDAHHGRFEVTSQPGQGTTFRLLLPIQPTL